MTLSYSGIVNYGKVTLPSVDSWGTNMNILRDPPKSVTTRKIDKVGETSVITSKIDESGDRACEAINYYARGVNPMVAMSYSNVGNNGGQRSGSIQTGGGGEAFLPYRVMRDGAFRPPSRRQEELLPLSRLPRIWTYMETQKYAPDYSKRMRNCGTAENTKEVKTTLLKADCEARKTIALEPGINAPKIMRSIVRDPLAPGQVSAAPSCHMGNIEASQRMALTPITLKPNRPATCGTTNFVGQKEVSFNHTDINLRRNHPIAQGTTNFQGVKESPIVFNNIHLKQNHPTTSGYTNAQMQGGPALPQNASYNYLPPSISRGGFEGRPGVPYVQEFHPVKSLIRVR